MDKGVISTGKLFNEKLVIPDYQRPYSWGAKSTLVLLSDICEAHKNNMKEYRLGTVILYKNSKGSLEIVDGQQRITTLLILLYILDPKEKYLKDNFIFNKLSFHKIKSNQNVLTSKLQGYDEDFKSSLKNYILDRCTVVKIVTFRQQEAFQFFDSQNSRGKSLEPHDLLKAYHLREMSDLDENEKKKIVEQWENQNQDYISNLFKSFLYPLVRWYKSKSGLHYSDKKIDTFKGIKTNSKFDFAVYSKAANLYLENYMNNNYFELYGLKPNLFQLTQPIIAGKRFFLYTDHYLDLLKKVINKVEGVFPKLPRQTSGDAYVYNMFLCALMFFSDRFGISELSEHVIMVLFRWAYSLRIIMKSVYVETVNKYAIGEHYISSNGNIFEFISEIKEPNEIDLFELELIDDNKIKHKTKYEEVINKIKEIQGR